MRLVHAQALLCIEKISYSSENLNLSTITLRAEPAFVLLSEEEKKEVLSDSHDPSEVAEARTSGPVNLVLYRQTGFPSATDRLLMKRWPYLNPLYRVHSF